MRAARIPGDLAWPSVWPGCGSTQNATSNSMRSRSGGALMAPLSSQSKGNHMSSEDEEEGRPRRHKRSLGPAMCATVSTPCAWWRKFRHPWLLHPWVTVAPRLPRLTPLAAEARQQLTQPWVAMAPRLLWLTPWAAEARKQLTQPWVAMAVAPRLPRLTPLAAEAWQLTHPRRLFPSPWVATIESLAAAPKHAPPPAEAAVPDAPAAHAVPHSGGR